MEERRHVHHRRHLNASADRGGEGDDEAGARRAPWGAARRERARRFEAEEVEEEKVMT